MELKTAGFGKEISAHKAIQPAEGVGPCRAEDHTKAKGEQGHAVDLLIAGQTDESKAKQQTSGINFESEPAQLDRIPIIAAQIPQQQRQADYEVNGPPEEQCKNGDEENPEGQHRHQQRGKDQGAKERHRINDLAWRIGRRTGWHQHGGEGGGMLI